MLRQIIAKEIVESVSGPKFLITFIICAALILVSVFSGWQLFDAEMKWHATAVNENKKALTNSGSYGMLVEEGGKAIREPSRLSIFVKGVDSAIGKSANLSRDPNIVLRDSRYGLNPVFATFGELDLAFIVKLILSLFALLFSYNAISGERELGTLKQVFSNSVGRAYFIVGKAVGGIVTLLITFLVPLLLALLMLVTVFNVGFSGDEWARIGLMTLVFSLYLMAFYMIGMLMSALTRQSYISFFLCLFVWVTSVAIVPKAAVELAGQISPAPSVDAVEAERAALMREYYAAIKESMTRQMNDYIARGVPPQREEYAKMRDATERLAREPMVQKYEALLREYERRQSRLLHTAVNMSRASPTACVTFAVGRLALTDPDLRERFIKALRRYREEFLAFANKKVEENPDKSSSGTSTSLSVDDDGSGHASMKFSMQVPEFTLDLAGIPVFSTEGESLEQSAMAVLPDIAILTLLFILAFAGAFAGFLFYDVRQ